MERTRSRRLVVLSNDALESEGLCALVRERLSCDARPSSDPAELPLLCGGCAEYVLVWFLEQLQLRHLERLNALRERGGQVQAILLAGGARPEPLRALVEEQPQGLALLDRRSALSGTDVLAAIDKVTRGRFELHPGFTRDMVDALDDAACRGELFARLAPAERRVADLMADGLRNHAIASHLCLSEKTVEKHVSSIFLKFDLRQVAADIHPRVRAAGLIAAHRPGKPLPGVSG